MDILQSLTSEQKKHMRIVQKLRILKKFNRRLDQRVSDLKHNKRNA